MNLFSRVALKVVSKAIAVMDKIFFRLWMRVRLPLFKRCGENVKFGRRCDFSYDHIELGNDVFIGSYAVFSAENSLIKIGNKVMFGPHVRIMGGDHRTDVIGQYIYDVTEKLPENDLDVTIENDVWVGTSAIILKGVTIGRGSIIGAGSVVTRPIPAYSIAAGNPAIVLKQRFDVAQIVEHERILGGSGNVVK